MTRGLQTQSPSLPAASLPIIPQTPTTSSGGPNTSRSTTQPSMESLQAQNAVLYSSIESLQASQISFQNQMADQMATFQQTILDNLHRFQQPNPSTTLPAITFGSLSSPTTSWTGLGLSNPPPPLPQDPSSSTLPLHFSTPIYSTITASSSQHHQIPTNTTTTPTSSATSIHSTIPYSSSPHFHQFIPTHYHSTFPSSSTQFHSPNHHNNHDLLIYKPPKIDLPRFHGEDVVGWLSMAERYLRTYRVPLHERVQAVASHFGPDPSVWMNAYELRNPAATWDHFVQALLEHFGSGNNTDFKATLSHLQHTTSVEDYITSFTKLSCRAPEWSDDQLLPISVEASNQRYDMMC